MEDNYQDLWDDFLKKEKSHQMLKPKDTTPYDVTIPVGREALDVQDMLLVSEQINRYFESAKDNTEYAKSRTSGMFGSKNPVTPSTLGGDSKIHPDSNFTDGPLIRSLSEIKIKIEAMERDFHAAEVEGNDSKEKSLKTKLDSLRQTVQELSDSLQPNTNTENV